MDFVRTPEERFENIEAYNFNSKYLSIDGLRMHYIDEGSGECILLLHGEPSWSYLYRKMIPLLTAKRYRCVAPDLIGFGKSDKPVERGDYTYANHERWLTTFLKELNLTSITLFCQDWGGLLGLRLVANYPERFARVLASNTFLPTGNEPFPEAFLNWRSYVAHSEGFNIGNVIQKGTYSSLSEEEIEAYNAPFPGEDYKIGARRFPELVPTEAQEPEGIKNQEIWQKLTQLELPFLTVFGADDPITRGARKIFQQLIPGAKDQPHQLLEEAGHFIQEDQPEKLSEALDKFIKG